MKRSLFAFAALCLGLFTCGESTRPPASPPGKLDITPGPEGGGGEGAARDYIWVEAAYLRWLPRSGTAWDRLRTYAARDFSWSDTQHEFAPVLYNPDNNADILALAKALVWTVVPGALSEYRTDVQNACLAIIGTHNGIPPGNAAFCDDAWIGVARNLTCYVLAADYVGFDTFEQNVAFNTFLDNVIADPLVNDTGCLATGKSLLQVGRTESNNIGAMARAALAAVFRYRDNTSGLEDLRRWFWGWLGNRALHAFEDFAENPLDSLWDTWHAGNADQPVPLLHSGTEFSLGGCAFDSLSGGLPEELRRGRIDSLTTWPSVTCLRNGGHLLEGGHVYGALSGAFVTAEIFRNYSNPGWNSVFTWEMNALERAVAFVEMERTVGPGSTRWNGFNGPCVQFPTDCDGDDWWILWIARHVYGGPYPLIHFDGKHEGKNMCFTDWTHQ